MRQSSLVFSKKHFGKKLFSLMGSGSRCSELLNFEELRWSGKPRTEHGEFRERGRKNRERCVVIAQISLAVLRTRDKLLDGSEYFGNPLPVNNIPRDSAKKLERTMNKRTGIKVSIQPGRCSLSMNGVSASVLVDGARRWCSSMVLVYFGEIYMKFMRSHRFRPFE